MSGLPLILTEEFAAGLVQAMIIVRSLTPMSGYWPIPTVWIEEQHRDLVVTTEHPVQQSAPISDHAYNRPTEVVLRLGWKGESPADIQNIYQSIISLKINHVLFDLVTGKRPYINMLFTNVAVVTDQHTENVLLATIMCKQMILVNTNSVQVPAGQQQIPTDTQQYTNMGNTQLTPATKFNQTGLVF